MQYILLWTELYTSQNSYVETLTPTIAAFEDRAFEEAIKVKWGHKDAALIWYD